MQFMSSWAADDNRTLLHFSKSTLETFCQHVQASDSDCEAGGLLLGSVHGAHMLIEQATVPTAWDKRFRYLFERMPFGHEAIALSRWTASQGTVRYLGEWHTHPEDILILLVSIDRNGTACQRSVGTSGQCSSVIVGRKALYVELVPSFRAGRRQNAAKFSALG
jgi:integrative and conjugative element protein (TIGR02256 family)